MRLADLPLAEFSTSGRFRDEEEQRAGNKKHAPRNSERSWSARDAGSADWRQLLVFSLRYRQKNRHYSHGERD